MISCMESWRGLMGGKNLFAGEGLSSGNSESLKAAAEPEPETEPEPLLFVPRSFLLGMK